MISWKWSRDKAIKILALFGWCIAVLSALEPHAEWFSALCGFLGNGCRDTEQFFIFHIPVAVWGIGFYAILSLMAFKTKHLVFWPIMVGFGVELTFAQIMITQQFLCFFCLLNLLTLVCLVVCVFRPGLVWQATAMSLLFFILSNSLVVDAVSPKSLSMARQNDTNIAATVGDVDISEADLEREIAGRLHKLRREIYNLKRKQLNDRIQKILIEKEANQKNISPDELTRRVYAMAPPVTKKDVITYYQENEKVLKYRKESKLVLKQKIKEFLTSRNRTDQMAAFLKPLKEKYTVTDLLDPPLLPGADIPIRNSPSMGPDDARVTIVEFSDYLCPSCRRAHERTQKIKDQYKGKIRWIFKDYPLRQHRNAREMAAAARCAGEQGKFWDYQDLLFASPRGMPIDRVILIKYADELGLDLNRFTQSLDSKKYMAAIEADIKDAKKAGVSATPTFIINGRMHVGSPSSEVFQRMIDGALKTP